MKAKQTIIPAIDRTQQETREFLEEWRRRMTNLESVFREIGGLGDLCVLIENRHDTSDWDIEAEMEKAQRNYPFVKIDWDITDGNIEITITNYDDVVWKKEFTLEEIFLESDTAIESIKNEVREIWEYKKNEVEQEKQYKEIHERKQYEKLRKKYGNE